MDRMREFVCHVQKTHTNPIQMQLHAQIVPVARMPSPGRVHVFRVRMAIIEIIPTQNCARAAWIPVPLGMKLPDAVVYSRVRVMDAPQGNITFKEHLYVQTV